MQTPQYQNHALRDLKSFSHVMAGFFSLLSLWVLYRANFTLNNTSICCASIAAAFLSTGYFFPQCLKPLYHLWMWLAYVMNFIMTRLILSSLFFVVLCPIGLFVRLRKTSQFRTDHNQVSYWQQRTRAIPPSHAEKMYTMSS